MFYVTIIQFLTVWGVEPVVTHGTGTGVCGLCINTNIQDCVSSK